MSLPQPNLDDPEQLAAYRRELRPVGQWFRWPGFGMVLAGCVWVLCASRGWAGVPRDSLTIGYGLLAVGWALLVVAFIVRRRYHRQRMGASR